MISISPALDGAKGKPKKGEQKFDYSKKKNFVLEAAEAKNIILFFNKCQSKKDNGSVTTSLIHSFQDENTILKYGKSEKGMFFIAINKDKKNISYTFNGSKQKVYLGEEQEDIVIPAELELFKDILQTFITKSIENFDSNNSTMNKNSKSKSDDDDEDEDEDERPKKSSSKNQKKKSFDDDEDEDDEEEKKYSPKKKQSKKSFDDEDEDEEEEKPKKSSSKNQKKKSFDDDEDEDDY
jgi:flagellar biosynthesis GTPase FlhF